MPELPVILTLIGAVVSIVCALIVGVKKIIRTLRYENANGLNKKTNEAVEKNTKDIQLILRNQLTQEQDIKEIKAILKSKN